MGALDSFEGACLTKWPGDVENDKRRVNGLVFATGQAVDTCRGLTSAERAAWTAWRAGWEAFYAKPVALVLGLGNECALTLQYERDVMGWQEQIRGRCDVPGPDPNKLGNGNEAMVKWVVVGVVAVAVALTARTVLR